MILLSALLVLGNCMPACDIDGVGEGLYSEMSDDRFDSRYIVEILSENRLRIMTLYAVLLGNRPRIIAKSSPDVLYSFNKVLCTIKYSIANSEIAVVSYPDAANHSVSKDERKFPGSILSETGLVTRAPNKIIFASHQVSRAYFLTTWESQIESFARKHRVELTEKDKVSIGNFNVNGAPCAVYISLSVFLVALFL